MRTENPIDSQLSPRPSIRVVPVQGERVRPVIVDPTPSPPSIGAVRSLDVFNTYKLIKPLLL